MGFEILVFVPNIIGYIRLLLLLGSWLTHYTDAWVSIILYSISISMDALDGCAARKLNQVSAFGAWLDVVVDILGRGMLWSRLYHFGYLVAALEWITFACNHSLGTQWKSSFTQEPVFVQKVMANNFKTPIGFFSIGSLQLLPIWLYAHYAGLLTQLHIPHTIQYMAIGLFASGRALCFFVEVWCIWTHILYLLSDEANRPSTVKAQVQDTSSM